MKAQLELNVLYLAISILFILFNNSVLVLQDGTIDRTLVKNLKGEVNKIFG